MTRRQANETAMRQSGATEEEIKTVLHRMDFDFGKSFMGEELSKSQAKKSIEKIKRYIELSKNPAIERSMVQKIDRFFSERNAKN
jgi:hypothetical protein